MLRIDGSPTLTPYHAFGFWCEDRQKRRWMLSGSMVTTRESTPFDEPNATESPPHVRQKRQHNDILPS